jgi:hypothetical protein
MRVYIIKPTGDGDIRMVMAKSYAQAIRYALKDVFEIFPATTAEVAQLVADKCPIEEIPPETETKE